MLHTLSFSVFSHTFLNLENQSMTEIPGRPCKGPGCGKYFASEETFFRHLTQKPVCHSTYFSNPFFFPDRLTIPVEDLVDASSDSSCTTSPNYPSFAEEEDQDSFRGYDDESLPSESNHSSNHDCANLPDSPPRTFLKEESPLNENWHFPESTKLPPDREFLLSLIEDPNLWWPRK